MGTTTSDGRVRRPRRIVPWLAGLGIVTTFGAAAVLFLWEVLSHFDDNMQLPPTPTIVPEIAAVAGLVALLACLPRLSPRVRAWSWSLSGVVVYFAVSSADWLAEGSIIEAPVLPLMAALSGGALVMAGALLASSGACARSAVAPAA